MTGIKLTQTSPLALNSRKQQTLRSIGSIIDRRKDQQASRALQVVEQARASRMTPEAAARSRSLADGPLQTPGLQIYSPEVLEQLESRVKRNEEQAFLSERPRTSMYLSNFNNAIAAEDDVETIGAFESFLTAGGLMNTPLRALDRFEDNFWAERERRTLNESLSVLRDGTKTLSELQAEELGEAREVQDQADASLGERSGRNQPRDQTREAGDEMPFIREMTAEAKGLWRWMTSRSLAGEEDTNERIATLESALGENLEDRNWETLERTMRFPLGNTRKEIEQRISEIDGDDPGESVSGMFNLVKERPGDMAVYIAEIGVESGLSTVAAITTMYLTKNPYLAAGAAGAISAETARGVFFDELMEEYNHDLNTVEGRQALVKDIDKLAKYGRKTEAYGLTIGLLDAVSAGVASKTLVGNPVGNMLVQMMVQSAAGGGGEALGRIAAGEKISWTDVLLEMMAETVTAPIEVAGLAASGVTRKAKEVRNARDRKKLFEILSGKAQASKLRSRDAKTFEGAVKAVTEDGPSENLYVDPDQMEELFQSGEVSGTLDEFFANLPELDQLEFQEAQTTGTYFKIPTALYAAKIAGSDIDGPLSDHIRLDPQSMSAAEADNYVADLRQAQTELAASTDKVETLIGELEGPLAEEFDRLRTEITQATGFTPAATEKYAALLVQSAKVGAQRAGMSIAEYLRRYTLPTVRGQGDVGTAPAVQTINPDLVVDALRSDSPAVEGVTDMSVIREALDEAGIDPEVASRSDIETVVNQLIDDGVLQGVMPPQESAVPTGPGTNTNRDEEYMQTATLRAGDEDPSQWGIDTSGRKKNKTRDVALALEKRQRKLYGKISKTQRGPRTVEKMAGWMATEIEFELQTPENAALGWYGEKFQTALDKMGKVLPALVDEAAAAKSNIPGVETVADARAVATGLFAVSSNGTKVSQNVENAVRILMEIEEGGGTISEQATHRVAINDDIQTILQLAEEYGGVGMQEYLTTEMTMSQVNKDLRAEGKSTKGGYPADMIVPRAAKYLGPKLAAFYANLAGSTGYLTMDLWWTRTINRYRGDVLPSVSGLKNAVNSKGEPIGLHRFKHLIGRPGLSDRQAMNYATEYAETYARKKYKNGTEAEKAANTIHKAANLQLAETPAGAADRAFMIQVAQATQAELLRRTDVEYSIADIQALIWYYEKRLYADMNVKDSGDISYDEAADIVAAKLSRPTYEETFNQGPIDTQSDAFTAWFGDSKVVDENGKPLVVYHGTNKGGFDVFDTEGRGKTADTGAFFTDSSFMASTYFSGPSNQRVVPPTPEDIMADPEAYDFDVIQDEDGDWEVYSPDGSFYPDASREVALEGAAVDWIHSMRSAGGGMEGSYEVYLSIKDPLVIDAKGANWDSIGGEEFFVEDADGEVVEYADTRDAAEDFVNTNEDDLGPLTIVESTEGEGAMSTDDLARMARDAGADGLIIENVFDGGPSSQGGENGTVYVAFEPTQIKSVDNRGTFDPSDPSILYQGPIDETGQPLGSQAPLPGAPTVEGASGPDVNLVSAAEAYAAEQGLPLGRQLEFVEVNPEFATRVAQAYEEMEHSPNDPAVKEAYKELGRQTMDQYNMLVRHGYEFTFFDDSTDPYDGNPWNAMRDLRANKRMAVYGTYAGYGTEGVTDTVDDNPLLEDTGMRWPDQNGVPQVVTMNDLFRAVHDAFGHGIEGAGFRARGEENAWQAHARLFYGSALAALTTETRGQNSWLNYGPHGEANRTASVEDTVFAEQKTGLLPEWAWTENVVGQENLRPDSDPATIEDFDWRSLRDMTPEEMNTLFKRPGWFIVTGARSEYGDNNSPENVERNEQLKASLESEGLQYVEMDGVYQGTPDGASFLVIGDDRTGRALGDEWGQESILTRDGLVFMDGSDNVPFDGVTYGFDAKREDFYSVIKDGLPSSAFSLNLQFPDAPDVTVDDGDGTSHYGARVVDGKMKLTHWSRQPLDELDPAFAGSGPLIGPERKRGGPKKLFFGLHIGRPTGYKRESYSLGDYRHEVMIDPRKVYPYDRDPDGLADKIDQTKFRTGLAFAGAYEQAIKDAGYAGFFVLDGPLGDAAVMFDKTAVDNVSIDSKGAAALRSREFNEWFGDSKVVNPDGSPKMVYHGTPRSGFSAFDRSLLGSERDAGFYGQGFYFTPSAGVAEEYAEGSDGDTGVIIPAYLSVEDPYIMDLSAAGWPATRESLILRGVRSAVRSDPERGVTYTLQGREPAEFAEALEAEGHDGILVVDEDGTQEVIVFRPEQVKSPFNGGNWDKTRGDILAQDGDKNNRGRIILPKEPTQQAIIETFGTADLSTVLHESGHFFLWQLEKQASDGLSFAAEELTTVTNWWKSNAAAIATEAGARVSVFERGISEAQVLEFLEVGTTGSGTVDRAVRTALHEQFARGFEAYALEGKSPSNTMRRVFESFAAWLISWYKSVQALNVNLDDNIREVFDRLIATEEEMTSAEAREEINNQIAETARELGLDEDTYRRLVEVSEEARDEGRQIARAEMLKTVKQARSREFKTRYAAIENEERERVNSKPVHRAIQWLGNGRWLGEGAPEGMPIELRFDSAQLVEDYGEEVLAKLPRGRRPVHVKDTLLSADEVAGWFGYDSGAELIQDMIETPKANDEIKAAVKARVDQELGDIMGDPGEIEEVAADALHGDKRGQVIVAEMRAMNRISGGRRKTVTSRAQAKAIAVEMIQRMQVRDAIRKTQYSAAERRHAENAARKLAEGDVAAAFEEKRKQLIQHALYIESKRVEELVGKAERLTGRLKRKGTRENLAPEYLGAIDDIMETYDFRKISGKEEVRRERLAAYIKMMNESGRADELAIPDHVRDAAKRIPYKRLSVRRLEGVYDSLKNIEHTARFKQKLRLAQEERELQEVRDDIAGAFNANIRGKPLNRVQTIGDRRKSGLKGYFNLVRNADTILRKIDGWANRGVMARMFKENIDRAGITAMQMREKATVDLDNLFSEYSTRERRQMTVRQMWDGYDQALSKWDLLSIAMNVGNKDNYDRLTSRDSRDSFSKQQIDNLLTNLDERDWRFVQSTWDYLNNEYWPMIAARERRVTGVEPKKVEAAMQVSTPNIPTWVKGGYYPIVYDSRYSSKVAEETNQELMENMMRGRFGKAQTKNGHTKERAGGGGGRTIQLGPQVLFGHINNVIHDLAFGEAVNQSWKLLQDPEVKGLFEQYNMIEDHKALELWVQDVATGAAAGTHVMAGTLRRLKSGFTLSKLAFNMSTVAIQITGITQSISVVGAGNFTKGLSRYLFSQRGRYGLAQDIKAISPFMAERETSFHRDVMDLINDTKMNPLQGPLSVVMTWVMKAGFWTMQKVQYYAVDVPTWLGAHEQGLSEGMSEADAIIHADRMVARAQASGLYADRTAVERGSLGPTSRQSEFLRLFTALGSYMFAKFNVTEEVLGRTARDIRDQDKSTIVAVLKAASDLTLLYVVEALMYNAIKGTLPGMDDEDDETWAAFLAKETALSVASVFPFIRDVSSAAQGYGGGGAYGGIAETIGRTVAVPANLASGSNEDAADVVRDLRPANDLIGLAFPGYPSTAVWRLIDGTGALGEEPSIPAAILGR